jgi:flagellar assembly factor FliW
MERGMIGLPDFRKFALIFDEDKGVEKSSIMWLQSMDDPETAFPVMHPDLVCPDYKPMVSNEVVAPIGHLTEDNLYVLVTVTAAADPKKTTVNLKAPVVINTDNMKACQVIVEDDYPVKYNIYDAVEKRKKEAEG